MTNGQNKQIGFHLSIIEKNLYSLQTAGFYERFSEDENKQKLPIESVNHFVNRAHDSNQRTYAIFYQFHSYCFVTMFPENRLTQSVLLV